MKRAFLTDWQPPIQSGEVPINPYRVIWGLMQSVDRNKTVVTHDAGSPRDQATAFYEATVLHGYMGWGKTTRLGMDLGLMQGAKLARPDWTCVNITGDAAIGRALAETAKGTRALIEVLSGEEPRMAKKLPAELG